MKTLMISMLLTAGAFGATLEERVAALESKNCRIANIYQGSYYKWCPFNSYAKDVDVTVQLNGTFAYTYSYVNCYLPTVVCN